MNDKQLQTKRQTKTGVRKLNAKVGRGGNGRRKQRASAAALDSNVPNPSISRSLTVILVMHVVAIAAVWIGIEWNKGRTTTAATAPEAPVKTVDLRNFNAELGTAFTETGDTYATFAARHNVDEVELRRVNSNAQIFAGKPLYLPPQKIKVAQPNTQNLAVSDRPPLPTTSNVVRVEVAQPQVTQPAITQRAQRAIIVSEASGATYKVQPGDSIWRISKKHKVSQDALMQLNNLKSARDLQAGMTLQIPAQ